MQLALLMDITRLCPGLGWGFRRQGNTLAAREWGVEEVRWGSVLSVFRTILDLQLGARHT